MSDMSCPLPPPSSPLLDRGAECPLDAPQPLTVFTIGHGSQQSDAFLALLRQHKVATVADVRSTPYSRYAPHFSKAALRAMLEASGIRYLWAGDALGGRPNDATCYVGGEIRPGNVDYQAIARRPIYQRGVRLLLAEAGTRLTAIMCSEEDPRRCHRHRLIEPSLRKFGVSVLHIRADGSLETIESTESALPGANSPQLELEGFGQ